MRKEGSVTKKIIALSLLVTYLLIAATYIAYLPQYNPLRNANNYTHAKTNLVIKTGHAVTNNAATMFVLLHRVYRSTLENKLETGDGLSKAALLILFFAIPGIMSALVVPGRVWFGGNIFYSRRQAYLTCRSIRI